MKLWIILVIGAIFLGCSVDKKLQRANKKILRLVKKHPELLKTDTIIWADTLIRWGIRVDTATSIHFDTIIIEKERLKIRLIRVRDSIFINGEILTDTIIREIRIPYERIVIKELSFWQKYKSLFWIFIIIVILYIVRKTLKL